MRQIGVNLWNIVINCGSGSGGHSSGGGVALKADFSSPNNNEAWVFW